MKIEANLISLGTAKLTNHEYGFSSKSSINEFDENIFLEKIYELGIRNIDTSPRYGKAQDTIGKFIKNNNIEFLVSSKVDNLIPREKKSTIKVIDEVKKNLEKLNLEKLDICYLHQNEIEIISDPYIMEGLMILRENNFINLIGASIYNNEEFDFVIKSKEFDIIQCPINVTDLKFYSKFNKENNNTKKIVARSVYLQGLLLNYVESDITNISNDMLSYFKYLDDLAKELSISRFELVKSVIFSLSNIHQFIIGTNKIENILKTLQISDIDMGSNEIIELINKAEKNKFWTNPRNWFQNSYK